MGLGRSRIKFEEGIDLSLKAVQEQFLMQTGLKLWVTVNLTVDNLLSYSGLISSLAKDAQAVEQVQAHYWQVFQVKIQTQDYEALAQLRDETKQQLSSLNRLGHYKFHIEQFYSLDVMIQNRILEFEVEAGQYYGINSLLKSLIDLGGRFEHLEAGYPEEWKKLKKWQEYDRHNRPTK